MRFLDRPVTVEVPATSANLGPGFDCLGLALDLRDTLTATSSGDLDVAIDGEGADELPRDEQHLVVRAMHAAWDRMGFRPTGVQLRCVNRIPQSRGLGSSSAAIVGGIMLARALVERGTDNLDDAAALALANELEGHPDNVAPALLGGFVVCGQDRRDGDDEVWAARLAVEPTISATAFVPPYGVHTEVARGLLPDAVPHHDACANTGRAALLVAALTGSPEHLLIATEDFVHQQYRRPAMPESLDLVERLRAAGMAAFVSGAGPTVLALHAGAPAADELARWCPPQWRSLPLAVGVPGARAF
ncbi:homoserine kinase [Nocardioides terrisoli]|uniref:homoserine kinase n=1 Tax=Nocardioides terrisoli TaxID=3388267 RepID=UPI00287B726D|nr:homoserine kinase [Nocardioides marmorisolisilvae]